MDKFCDLKNIDKKFNQKEFSKSKVSIETARPRLASHVLVLLRTSFVVLHYIFKILHSCF